MCKHQRDANDNKKEVEHMTVLAKPVRTMPVIKEKDTKAFIKHFNESKVSTEFWETCKKAGKLFGTNKA